MLLCFYAAGTQIPVILSHFDFLFSFYIFPCPDFFFGGSEVSLLDYEQKESALKAVP